MSRFALWRRMPVAWARRLRRLGIVALAVLVGFSVYQGLNAPSRESRDIKARLNHEIVKLHDDLRRENAKLCAFFTTTDDALCALVGIKATTVAGEVIRAALAGVRAAAREVATSPICPPPSKGSHPTPTPTPGG